VLWTLVKSGLVNAISKRATLEAPLDLHLLLWQNVFTMTNKPPRMTRESNTIAVMFALYCRNRHASNGLCSECVELLGYARERLEKCPFQEGKTTCAKCVVHCYRPVMREKIRVVMRYSGPRMIYRHPILAIFHLVDGLRKEPVHRHKGSADS